MNFFVSYAYAGDYWYLAIVVISMIIGIASQAYIKKTYAVWSHVETRTGKTGKDIASEMLMWGGSQETSIGHVGGTLSDYFDPRDNSLHLSPDNYQGASVASVAVACHEAGHAIQTAQGLVFARVRMQLAPVAQIAEQFWSVCLVGGIFLNIAGLVQIGIGLFAAIVLFQIITLPVEIDASRRALAFLSEQGSIVDKEGTKRVLTAAALTYVSAALVSIMQLVYMLSRNRSND